MSIIPPVDLISLIHNDQAIFCDKVELTFAGAEPIYGARLFVASVLGVILVEEGVYHDSFGSSSQIYKALRCNVFNIFQNVRQLVIFSSSFHPIIEVKRRKHSYGCSAARIALF